jgi:CRISPR/Cas system-associated exonuclease Cas4 (RecB family)
VISEPRRKKPYVWVSWLTKLLSGEERCWYRLWYKAHFKYEKVADPACEACKDGGTGGPCEDPETCRVSFFRSYNEKHDAITNRREAELKAEGYVTRKEKDAEFKLQGKSADVAGKPDLVGVQGQEVLVIDAKSGRRRDSDHWQVLIYMFGLPLSWLGGEFKLRGEVAYKDGNVAVQSLTTASRNRIVAAVNRASEPEPPAAAPSAQECKYCDVAACEYRYKAEAAGDASRYF